MKLLISNSILIILENRKEHFSFLNHLIKKLYNKLYKDQDFSMKKTFCGIFIVIVANEATGRLPYLITIN